MSDPHEGLTPSGLIRTGAAAERVSAFFAPIHHAAVEMLPSVEVALYAYGSVVTGQARPQKSDVDLLTVGLGPSNATAMSVALSGRFAERCRGVEVAAAKADDFVGGSDEAYGNAVFLRHYCVLLAGLDRHRHRPPADYPGDARAARGFNGDIAVHLTRWREAIAAGDDPTLIARRAARKVLLAVAGLVSVHDHTWTTDRRLAAQRWASIHPELAPAMRELLVWSEGPPDLSVDTVVEMFDGPVEALIQAFDSSIGMWQSTV